MAKQPAEPPRTASEPRHVFDFLERETPRPLPSLCVLFGEDPYLKQLAYAKLRAAGAAANDLLSDIRFDGAQAEFRRVADELRSASLFGGNDVLVLVQDADKFVSDHRALLERYLEQPGHKPLVLQTQHWLKTTRLHKQLLETGLLVDCSVPQRRYGNSSVADRKALSKWFVNRATRAYGRPFAAATVDYLIDLVGPEPGILDQELQKLATYVPSERPVTNADVDQIGSGWRLRTTWDVLDAVLDGKAAEAMQQLHRLLQSGDEPIAFFGALSWSLRRFAAAAAHSDWSARTADRRDIPASLRAAGFRDDYGSNRPAKAEAQLRQLGYERCIRLSARLIEIDLQLKGSHSAAPHARRILEEFIVDLSAALRLGRPASQPPTERHAVTTAS